MVELAAPVEAARLTEFSRALRAAARSVTLYPETHPTITAVLGRLTQLTTPPALTGEFTIGVIPHGLLIDGLAPARPDASITELAATLHAHRVGELKILSVGDNAAWRNFVLLLEKSPDDVRADGGIARAWTTMAGSHVHIREIDYTSVLRERIAGDSASWQGVLTRCLTGDDVEFTDELVANLIDGFTASDSFQAILPELDKTNVEGPAANARSAGLARFLERIVNTVRNKAPEQLETVMGDLSASLGGLSPATLLALIERGRARDEVVSLEQSGTVDRLIKQMTDGTIARFVARTSSAYDAPVERVAQAFQALVPEKGRRHRLVTLARQWAQQADLTDSAFDRHWENVAKKLLTHYADQSYVSEAYARELSSARTQAVQIEALKEDPPERLERWLSSVSMSEIRRLDIALLLDLLRIEQDDERRAVLANPLEATLTDLIVVGDFEVARSILAALEPGTEKTPGAPADALARVVAYRLTTPAIVSNLIDHLATADSEQFGNLAYAARWLGPDLMTPLIEALAKEEHARVRERLTEILSSFGEEGRRRLDELRHAANHNVRRTAIFLLSEFGGGEALPDFGDLVTEADSNAQREAVRLIIKNGSERGYRLLEKAIVTGTPATRDAIMRSLGSRRDERAGLLLAHLVEHLDHSGELHAIYIRAVDLIGQLRDPRAVSALRQALDRGDWWSPRKTSTLRTSVATALAKIGTDDAVAALEDAAHSAQRGVRQAAQEQLEQMVRARTGAVRH